MKTADLHQLLLDFAEAASLSNSRLLQGDEKRAVWMVNRGLVAGLSATASIAGRQVNIRIGLSRNFPYQLPVVRLDGAETLPHIPHVEEDGAVCFIVPKGLVIDQHSPMGILEDTLSRALNTLQQGWQGNVADEFMDEFGAYWRGTHPTHRVTSFLKVGGSIREVQLKMAPQSKPSGLLRVPNQEVSRRGSESGEKPHYLPPKRPAPVVAEKWREKQVWKQQDVRRAAVQRRATEPEQPLPRGLGSIFDSPTDPANFHQQHQTLGGRHALYVPLPQEARIQPPRPGVRWSASDVRQIVREALPTEKLNQLNALSRKCGDELLIILGLPRPSGGTTLIGLRYFGLKGVHPLGPASDVRRLRDPETVWVDRLDRELITSRGGASTDLATKKVLLVGCGSVGGHVAMMLASTGIGELTLLDGDVLSPENVFRHVLGKKALGRRKVKALVREIQERSPYIKVRGIPLMLDAAVVAKQVDLSGYDLIISATGEPSVDLDLNTRLSRLRDVGKPAAIFTWLEPFGIGGHAALSIGGSGCFECLYTLDEEESSSLHNRAAFYASVQPRDFNLDLVGCGSFYAPYSDLDARRTAELAVRLALASLQGREAASTIRSWKGDPASFLAEGFLLSKRYGLSSDELLAGVQYAAPNCRACNCHKSAGEQAA